VCILVFVYLCIHINICIDIYRDIVRLQRLCVYTGVYLYLHMSAAAVCVHTCEYINLHTCIYTYEYIVVNICMYIKICTFRSI